MAYRLAFKGRAQIAACYKVWRSIDQVRKWLRTVGGKHAQIDPKTIKNGHEELMVTESVADIQGIGHRSKPRDPEIVQVVEEIFTRSLQNNK